jgi:hypothetical protein
VLLLLTDLPEARVSLLEQVGGIQERKLHEVPLRLTMWGLGMGS